MPCSKCGKSGHNIKTCKKLVKTRYKKHFRPKKKEKEKEQEKEKETCIICYDEVGQGNGQVVTKCNHIYCATCFIKCIHVNSSCAYCRTDMCEKLPPKPTILSEDERNEILDDVVNDNLLHNEFMREIRKQLKKCLDQRGHDRLYSHDIDQISDDELNLEYAKLIIGWDVILRITGDI